MKLYEYILSKKEGKSAGMTPTDIAKKQGVSLGFINKQIKMGQKVELEHTKNKKIAKKISSDHVAEIGDYYKRLKKMEKQAEKK